jgi:hypothetical protein
MDLMPQSAASPHTSKKAGGTNNGDGNSGVLDLLAFQDSEYDYRESLDAGTIRLVQIQSANSAEGQLQLVISKHEMASAPSYHSISYTWGPPEEDTTPYTADDRRAILLNGSTFYVLPNLHDALVRLQGEDEVSYIWVDAICINQEDTREREIQVAIMNQIYSKAKLVIIWVGNSAEDSEKVIELVQLVAGLGLETRRRFLEERQIGQLHVRDDDRYQQLGLPPLTIENWGGFIKFFQRRWFNRAWVIQELALSQEAVLVWGEHAIPWVIVVQCSSVLSTTRLARGLVELQNPEVREKPYAQIGTASEAIILAYAICHGLTELYDQGKFITEIMVMLSGKPLEASVSGCLLILLLRFRPFFATDARDKVFSLLGLLNAFAQFHKLPMPTTKAQYGDTVTAAGVFTTATTTILEECKHLGVLGLKGDTSVNVVEDLPSWVPDYSVVGSNPICMAIQTAFPTNKDMINPSKYKIGDDIGLRVDGKRLYVKAVQVGTVSQVTNRCMDLHGNGHFEEFAALILQCPDTYAPTGQPRIEALWRTLIFDTDDFNHPAKNDSKQISEAFNYWLTWTMLRSLSYQCNAGEVGLAISRMENLDRLASTDDSQTLPTLDHLEYYGKKLGLIVDPTRQHTEGEVEQTVNELLRRLGAFQALSFASLPFRRMFLTTEGYLGMGLQSTQPGDTIWVASSSPCPFVMREHPEVPDCYQLVGESYVHGIMHGEALSENTAWREVCLI